MKYALVNGTKTHAKDVISGTLGKDIWFTDYKVKACVGKYRQYWVYLDGKPNIPHGYEPESEWHSAWKTSVKDEYCEVICGENREHRADIRTSEYVIEIQKSPIDGWAVIARNKFYMELMGNRLVWVVNVEEPWKKKRFNTEFDKKSKDGRFIIKWSYAWKWVIEIAVTKDTFLFFDFNRTNNKLIMMWKYDKTLYGKWVSKVDFFNLYLKGVSKEEFQNNPDKFLNCFQ